MLKIQFSQQCWKKFISN